MTLPRCLVPLLLMTSSLAAVEPTVIPIWPEGVPGALANGGAERLEDGRIANVHVPTLTYFPAPKETANGTAVIICPGGGYTRLSVTKEGTTAAAWLNSLGVSAFVLKYRLGEYGHPAPLRDVLRAVRLVRSRAAEFGVDPQRLGVFGFSAGGHLASSAATLFDHPDGRTGAALDTLSARPDFVALIYPVILMDGPFVHAGSQHALLGPAPAPERVALLSTDRQVTAQTPPTFIVHAQDDTVVPVENALAFYTALRRAGIPAEMDLFEKGGHGFGLLPGPATTWPLRCAEWMRLHGWVR
jgi:acetyl esterase/lipase